MIDKVKGKADEACPLPPGLDPFKSHLIGSPTPAPKDRTNILFVAVFVLAIIGFMIILGVFSHIGATTNQLLIDGIFSVGFVGAIVLLANIFPSVYNPVGQRKFKAGKLPKRDSWLGVKMPPNSEKIIEVLTHLGKFESFLKAIKSASLDTLDGVGPYTVFVPTDLAFEKVPEGALDELISDTARLRRFLQYHIVAGKFTAKTAMDTRSVKTVEGHDADVNWSTMDGVFGAALHEPSEYVPNWCINDAYITKSDIMAANGVIHAIDRVLIPPDVEGLVNPNYWNRDKEYLKGFKNIEA